MKSRICLILAFSLTCSITKITDAEQQATTPTATQLLWESAGTYARANDLRLEMQRKEIDDAPLRHSSQEVETSMVRSSGKFRIETHSGWGSWIQMSDGQKETTYWVDANRYEQHPATGKFTYMNTLVAGNNELQDGWNVLVNLERLARETIDAKRLPDATLIFDHSRSKCFVIQGRIKPGDDGYTSERTFWIDKQTHLIRKFESKGSSYILADVGIRIPFKQTITQVFPVFDLNPTPSNEEFTFVAPEGATKVDTMELHWAQQKPPAVSKASSLRKERIVPNTSLYAADGSAHTLSDYRGKAVVVDLWATWCGPCLVTLPDFAKLMQEFTDSGVVTISIDEDEIPSSATDYLHLHNFSWTNLHDKENGFQKALRNQSVPLTLVLDRNGRIIFEQNVGAADYEARLRAAIKKATSADGIQP